MLIFGDIFAVAYYKRHADWKLLRTLLPWVLPGMACGFIFLMTMKKDDPILRVPAMVQLGSCLKSQQRLEEAEAWLRDAVRLTETCYGPEATVHRHAQQVLASILSDMGRLREAEEILREHDSSASVIGKVVEGAEKRVTLSALNLSGTGSRFA